MSEKFTPGPWTITHDPDGGSDDYCIGVVGGKVDQVAVCSKRDAQIIAARADARITELEIAITVRDTEIARLETDLELARVDQARYRWLRSAPPHSIRWPLWSVNEWNGRWWSPLAHAELDAAIDAARGDA